MKGSRVVVVFGSFDGLHDGHRHFLYEAKKQGDQLIAVVAQDAYIHDFKGRDPRYGLQERIEVLKAVGIADEVMSGDSVQDSWEVLERIQPQVIALGYDQTALREALEKKSFDTPVEIVQVSSHKPKLLHSSILFR